MFDIRLNNGSFVPGEDTQLFHYLFKTNIKRSLFVSPGQWFGFSFTNSILMHNGSAIVRYIYTENVLCQEELCSHPQSLWDSLVSISRMMWKRPVNVADPFCMFYLWFCHHNTMERELDSHYPNCHWVQGPVVTHGVNTVCVPPSAPRQLGQLTSLVPFNLQ